MLFGSLVVVACCLLFMDSWSLMSLVSFFCIVVLRVVDVLRVIALVMVTVFVVFWGLVRLKLVKAG